MIDTEQEQRTRSFNPNDHVIQIKNRGGAADYLPVQWRLVWFREQCPEGTIETEMLHLDLDKETEEEAYAWNNDTRRSEKIIKHANGIAVFRAIAKDGKGGVATGTKSEKAASFPDFIEKAETGAIGRALAALGYGTQFAPELNEEHRIADAPVDRTPNAARQPMTSVKPSVHTIAANQETHTTVQDGLDSAFASDQQIASIRKLCQHLGKAEPENAEKMTYTEAKELITQLSAEYREQKQQPSQSTNSVNAPSVRELRKRCVELFRRDRLDEIKVKLFGANIADDNVTPEQAHEIKIYLDGVINKGAA